MSQDKSAALQKVKERYEKSEQYSCSVLYSYYNSMGKLSEELKGYYFKSGNRWRMDLPALTFIYDGQIFIQIHDSQKQIIIINDQDQLSKLPVIDQAKFLQAAALLTELSNSSSLVTYQYSTKGIMFNTYYNIEIDKRRWLVTGVTIYSGNDPSSNSSKLKISFTSFNDHDVAVDGLILNNEFIAHEVGSIVLKPAFQKYKLTID